PGVPPRRRATPARPDLSIVTPLVITPGRSLRGVLRVPGDKSISHRAAILGAIARGTTRIFGYLQAEDTLSTLGCLRALGVSIQEQGSALEIRGGALREPDQVLDVGNSGTTLRLLAGLFAEGETSVAEPSQSRDHTERRLGAFGVEVAREGLTTRLRGPAALNATEVRVPGDLSSAAFLLVAAALVPGSELAVTGV